MWMVGSRDPHLSARTKAKWTGAPPGHSAAINLLSLLYPAKHIHIYYLSWFLGKLGVEVSALCPMYIVHSIKRSIKLKSLQLEVQRTVAWRKLEMSKAYAGISERAQTFGSWANCACKPVYVCMHVCACVWMCVYDVYVQAEALRTGWNALLEVQAGNGEGKLQSPELKVVLLFCIIIRAIKSSQALCHPSSGHGTRNPGEGARNCFFTDRLPSFCPRERPDGGGQCRGSHSLGSPPVCQP